MNHFYYFYIYFINNRGKYWKLKLASAWANPHFFYVIKTSKTSKCQCTVSSLRSLHNNVNAEAFFSFFYYQKQYFLGITKKKIPTVINERNTDTKAQQFYWNMLWTGPCAEMDDLKVNTCFHCSSCDDMCECG